MDLWNVIQKFGSWWCVRVFFFLLCVCCFHSYSCSSSSSSSSSFSSISQFNAVKLKWGRRLKYELNCPFWHMLLIKFTDLNLISLPLSQWHTKCIYFIYRKIFFCFFFSIRLFEFTYLRQFFFSLCDNRVKWFSMGKDLFTLNFAMKRFRQYRFGYLKGKKKHNKQTVITTSYRRERERENKKQLYINSFALIKFVQVVHMSSCE